MQDITQYYLKLISKIPLLSKEEEIELWQEQDSCIIKGDFN